MTRHLIRPTCIAALLAALSLQASAAINLADQVPVGPQVTKGVLPNGLTYYIHKNGKPAQKLELRLVVKAGSTLEDEDQQGLAHFTEHMAFNGSTHFKKHELISYLQSIGVKFGADLNAFTSFDETVYILPIPTNNPANIETGFTVLEDWAHGLSFNDKDIDMERGIVLEEARLGKGASDRMNKVLLPKIFNGSRYAQRLPIGKEDILKSFPHDAVKRFYRDWYRPDLMAVVAVGDIDPQEVEKQIKAHFSGLKNPDHERVRSYAAIGQRSATEAIVVTDKEASGNAVLIRYPLQNVKEDTTFRGYRHKLVEQLFAAMLGQRMQELTQQAAPPFLGGGSNVDKLVAGYKSFSSFAVLGHEGVTPAIDALVQENERARKYGFSAQELERVKKNLARNFEQGYAERDKTDSNNYAEEYIRNFLEQESIPGMAAEYGYAKEFIPSITLEEVNAYARSVIPEKAAKLVAYMGSTKEPALTPTSEQLMAGVARAEQRSVAARTEKAVAASLMDKPPKAGSIVAETSDAALGLTRLTLSNGVKVILKPTDFKNDQVVMSASRFGGQLLFDDKDNFNARYANAIVGTMGVSRYAPIELQNILAGKTAWARPNMGNYTEGISGGAGNNDVDTMLQLVYLQFTGVRRDEDLYRAFIAKQQDVARNAMSQPEAIFRDTVLATTYGNHPRVARTARPDDFAQVNLERGIGIYKERFSSAKDLTFILVGSFDVAAVKPLIATYLASLPTPDIPVAYRDVGIRPVTGVVKKEVRSGSEAKSSVSLNFTGNTNFSEMEQLRFYAMIEVMNLRITDVLREKLNLIYSGGMHGSFNKFPYANYAIGTSLPCGPDNVDKVIAATFAEIEKLKQKGPDVEDLEKVIQNWMQGHQKAMRENGYWLGRLQTSLLQGTDPATILAYEANVASITPAQIKAAAQRYFDTNNYIQVVLYPEK
ncbi:MAG: insulinase family protein [Pseudomonadota bacterium]